MGKRGWEKEEGGGELEREDWDLVCVREHNVSRT